MITLFHNHQVRQQEKVFDVYYQAMGEMNQDNVEYQSYEQQEDRIYY
jgi:hypothetical protein